MADDGNQGTYFVTFSSIAPSEFSTVPRLSPEEQRLRAEHTLTSGYNPQTHTHVFQNPNRYSSTTGPPQIQKESYSSFQQSNLNRPRSEPTTFTSQVYSSNTLPSQSAIGQLVNTPYGPQTTHNGVGALYSGTYYTYEPKTTHNIRVGNNTQIHSDHGIADASQNTNVSEIHYNHNNIPLSAAPTLSQATQQTGVEYNNNKITSLVSEERNTKEAKPSNTDAPTASQDLYPSLTIFRSTIPDRPDDIPNLVNMTEQVSSATPPSGHSVIESTVESHTEMAKKSGQGDTEQEATSHVISAVVHNPEPATDIPENGVVTAIEENVSTSEIESQYAKPQTALKRKSAVVSETNTEPPQVKENGTNVDEQEVYSEVNKPRASQLLNQPDSEEEDVVKDPPPIPEKTDISYLAKDESSSNAGSVASRGSAMEAIKKKADEIREDQDYYSTVESDVPDTKSPVIHNDFEDYATVGASGDVDGTDEDSDDNMTTSSRGIRNRVRVDDDDDYATVGADDDDDDITTPGAGNSSGANAAASSNGTRRKVTADGDFDDYATVDIDTSEMAAPATPAKPDRHVASILPPQTPDRVISNSPVSSAMNLSDKATKVVDFNLPKGYNIGHMYNLYIHEKDITKLKVDAIVNAANGKLKHGAGVAGAISKAAGKEFEKECKKLMKKRSQIQVSEVVVTGSGKLNCTHVLHAVGPMWAKYSDKAQCDKLLKNTFINVFKSCSSENLTSVALPPISAGEFGVPHGRVSECLHRALLDITSPTYQSEIPTCPKQIHVVDVTPNVLYCLIEKLIAGNRTSDGITVSVEELSRDQVEAEVAAISDSTDTRKKKKMFKLPSLDKTKGGPTQSSGQLEATRL